MKKYEDPGFLEDIKFFKTQKRTLLNQGFEGKYVLIHNGSIDIFCCYEDAIRQGYRRYGLERFFVGKIERFLRPIFIGQAVACT